MPIAFFTLLPVFLSFFSLSLSLSFSPCSRASLPVSSFSQNQTTKKPTKNISFSQVQGPRGRHGRLQRLHRPRVVPLPHPRQPLQEREVLQLPPRPLPRDDAPDGVRPAAGRDGGAPRDGGPVKVHRGHLQQDRHLQDRGAFSSFPRPPFLHFFPVFFFFNKKLPFLIDLQKKKK